MDALALHRIHFGFTVTYHYLFPQLTMGLALLIVILKTMALRTKDERYNVSARFWAKIFAVNFLLGVVTGIPMEFQFGTNWSEFSRRTGGVIGQPLAMEGVFSFFLESSFLGLFLFGEKRLSRFAHWSAAFLVFCGSWISGFFIIVTDAWMQHPVAYQAMPNGTFEVASFWGLMMNPTGDLHGKYMAKNQPIATAAMEGLFRSQTGAPIVLMGQPDVEGQKIDNPIAVNKVLSFLIYGTTAAEVKGLDQYPKDLWPTTLPLLFYSYHIMAGLGTYFVALMAVAAFLLWRGKLYTSRWILWPILLSFPLPYIANTAGWMTAEIGRQPWLVYNLIRTSDGYSTHIGAGTSLFSLLGFLGMYTVLSILWIMLVYNFIHKGPDTTEKLDHHTLTTA